jgi:hypothetical protein
MPSHRVPRFRRMESPGVNVAELTCDTDRHAAATEVPDLLSSPPLQST